VQLLETGKLDDIKTPLGRLVIAKSLDALVQARQAAPPGGSA
jgi:hypothetical protein